MAPKLEHTQYYTYTPLSKIDPFLGQTAAAATLAPSQKLKSLKIAQGEHKKSLFF